MGKLTEMIALQSVTEKWPRYVQGRAVVSNLHKFLDHASFFFDIHDNQKLQRLGKMKNQYAWSLTLSSLEFNSRSYTFWNVPQQNLLEYYHRRLLSHFDLFEKEDST